MDVANNSGSRRRAIVRTRFWFQLVLGGLFSALLGLTLAVPDWIEEVFGVDPDRGNGSLEWIIVVVCGVTAAASFGWARAEWRRTPLQPTAIATD